MRQIKFTILALTCLPFVTFCQARVFEIFGTISGDYDGRIYLFFEDNYKQRDSISSEIKDGKFYFKGQIFMPIQARLHMGQQSLIRDIYIDNSKTYVKCQNELNLYNNGKDTLNLLSVVNVEGSNLDREKDDFETWVNNLKKSNTTDEGKREAYYKKLVTYIKNYPKSKLGPYLLGKASMLYYSQVKDASTLMDTSLNRTFEFKSVIRLLNELDKSKNIAVGMPFRDFALQDSSGQMVEAKQFRGKYVLIVFWASWCKPCREEHPELLALYKKYKDSGFEILGVSLDEDKEKWKQAIIKDQLQWTQVIDPKAFEGELAEHYGIDAIPTSFLLNKQGKIEGVSLTPTEIEEIMENIYR